jgi:hypothetical protein
MKKISVQILIVLFSIVVFIGCSEDKQTEDQTVETAVSQALRIALNRIINNANPSGRLQFTTTNIDAGQINLCFDFVYPITLSYNTGTNVVVNSIDDIVSLLQNETNNAYLNGIAFPFQIVFLENMTIIEIADEQGFEALNFNCNDSYYVDDAFIEFDCFEFQFPISVVNTNNEVFAALDLMSLYNLIENTATGEIIDFVYPFNILVGEETVVVENMYQFSEILSICYENDFENPDAGNTEND